jgi:hypothetical protein
LHLHLHCPGTTSRPSHGLDGFQKLSHSSVASQRTTDQLTEHSMSKALLAKHTRSTAGRRSSRTGSRRTGRSRLIDHVPDNLTYSMGRFMDEAVPLFEVAQAPDDQASKATCRPNGTFGRRTTAQGCQTLTQEEYNADDILLEVGSWTGESYHSASNLRRREVGISESFTAVEARRSRTVHLIWKIPLEFWHWRFLADAVLRPSTWAGVPEVLRQGRVAVWHEKRRCGSIQLLGSFDHPTLIT